jgi:hypothetical protein
MKPALRVCGSDEAENGPLIHIDGTIISLLVLDVSSPVVIYLSRESGLTW